MRLFYLALSAVFGSLFAFFGLALLSSPSKTEMAVCGALGLLCFICIRKYRKTVTSEQSKSAQNAQKDNLTTQAYCETRKEELDAYSQEINGILINRYHFKAGSRPAVFRKHLYKSFPFCDIQFHQKNLTANDAAKIIYDEIVFQGNDYDPEIFQDNYTRGKYGKFAKFNKIIFGAYAPTRKLRIVVIAVFLTLILILYGIPQAFLGPNHDLFVPSESWNTISSPLAIAVTLIASYLAITNKKYRYSLIQREGKFMLPVIYFLIPFTIWLMMQAILSLGLPKFLNEVTGLEKVAFYTATKDPDTEKRNGKYSHTTAYCVKLKAPNVSILENEYCIRKEDYDRLPAYTVFVMKFNGTSSYFGYRIQGYFPGFALPSEFPQEILDGKN